MCCSLKPISQTGSDLEQTGSDFHKSSGNFSFVMASPATFGEAFLQLWCKAQVRIGPPLSASWDIGSTPWQNKLQITRMIDIELVHACMFGKFALFIIFQHFVNVNLHMVKLSCKTWKHQQTHTLISVIEARGPAPLSIAAVHATRKYPSHACVPKTNQSSETLGWHSAAEQIPHPPHLLALAQNLLDLMLCSLLK